jgi:hypothetical protein
MAQPGSPRLRLWANSAQILFGAPDALPRLTPNWEKMYFDLAEVNGAFQKTPLPLGAVYLLSERRGDSHAPFVEPVHPQAGLLELVGNTYLNYLLDRSMRAWEFEVLGRLARCVPLRRVVPHEDPAYLPTLCEVILEDFNTLSPLEEQADARF